MAILTRFRAGSHPVRRAGMAVSCAAVTAAGALVITGHAGATPDPPAPPLPVFSPTPTNWGPDVYNWPWSWPQYQPTDADINSERDMCEWFNAQFDTLMGQIGDFNGNLGANGDDYGADGIQQQADAVTRNIDQSLVFLSDRADAFHVLTSCDSDGACYDTVTIKGVDQLKDISEQLNALNIGIRANHAAWINNFTIGRIADDGNKVRQLGVCA